VKLIGSAQLRRSNVILQHGSIRLALDPKLFEQVFGAKPVSYSIPQTESQIIQALTEAAESCFGIEIRSEPLKSTEWEAISTLQAQLNRNL
jgi:lipoate-protein ligase A